MQNGIITNYTLDCTSTGGAAFGVVVNTAQDISLGVFTALEEYSCTIFASTAAGPGPNAMASVVVPGM